MSSPSRIGRYHVIGRIASGGMAEIFLAKVLGPGGFERPVVIKRALPHLVDEAEFRDMFLDEARIVAAINHQNVVQVHELGRKDDELFLVMEYLAGESACSLGKRAAARDVRLDYGLCAHIIAEACAGLHAAHEFTDPDGKPLHVVHRDVCPNNLFVTYDGSVKVVDFGIAQAADRFTLTEAGQVKGKAAYMAPEQCLCHPLDRRTDVFALGVVLYELTTGHRLFSAALESRILSCLQQEEVQPPSRVVKDYPAALERICLRALRFDPEKRFATAEEMRRELVRFQRARAGDGLPEEQLRRCMRELFQDRIEEKADLLSRLRAGSGISHIPSAEVADDISVPLVVTDRKGSGARALGEPRDTTHVPVSTSSQGDTTRGPPRRKQQKKRVPRVVSLAAACAVAGLAGVLLWAARVSDERQGVHQKPEQIAVASARPGPSLEEPPPRAVAVAPVPKQVTIELISKPPGAGAWLAQLYRGLTPVSVALPRQSEPVQIRLQLAGHHALEQRLVPNKDQRLIVSLSPVAAAKPSSPRPSRAGREREANPDKGPTKSRQGAKPAKEEFFLFE